MRRRRYGIGWYVFWTFGCLLAYLALELVARFIESNALFRFLEG
jgi:hypothetical protein